ncbi:ImmA/IrrE family metallo-endopeptidase [Polynucleobacter victoriensis]|uniref:Zn-dependent peptidase ImmA, M78 family n=1 Tax=Polynucleobacter victoriensis TaxID=2049319 RepID=A0A212U180_9BURK|nr:Zn-dependent peptidase ImmA, M78 family [Polynucleobacter victoriensis]
MTTLRTSNNPRMLVWAREETGLDIVQAAEAIGVSLGALVAAENGERSLTLNQLRKAAEMYDIPFGNFYLSEPPRAKSFHPIPDFRSEPGVAGADHYRLNLEIKKCRDRRDIYLDLMRSLEIPVANFEVLKAINENSIGTKLRGRLGISQTDIRSLNFDGAYVYWKQKIEDSGVLVYESQYIPDVTGVIGAAMFYEVCPIILLKRGPENNERKLFTLLHEYAHLLLGESAINDAGSLLAIEGQKNTSDIEVACNRLAAELLIPTESVDKSSFDGLDIREKMELLSRQYKVTYSTAAVCLRRLGLISQSELRELLDGRRRENQLSRRSSGEARIPRENINRLDMGRPLFKAALEAYAVGILDVYDASRILNLRVKKIDRLVSKVKNEVLH